MRFNYFYDSKHVSDTVALKWPDRKCKGQMNFVWERIKDICGVNLTRYSLIKSALVQSYKNTITPHSQCLNTSYQRFICRPLKNMIFYTSLWSRWNKIHAIAELGHKCLEPTAMHAKIWTLKQLHHCTQRLNHEDI